MEGREGELSELGLGGVRAPPDDYGLVVAREARGVGGRAGNHEALLRGDAEHVDGRSDRISRAGGADTGNPLAVRGDDKVVQVAEQSHDPGRRIEALDERIVEEHQQVRLRPREFGAADSSPKKVSHCANNGPTRPLSSAPRWRRSVRWRYTKPVKAARRQLR